MVSLKSVSAIALFGAAMVMGSAAVRAQEPWLTYRQELYTNCEQYTGHARGICMQAAYQTMQDATNQSQTMYQDCLSEDNSRDYCDKQREDWWNSQLAS